MGHDTEKDNSTVFLIAGAQDILFKPLRINQLKNLLSNVRKPQSED
jgi:DNA-binding response OmpR family regulator